MGTTAARRSTTCSPTSATTPLPARWASGTPVGPPRRTQRRQRPPPPQRSGQRLMHNGIVENYHALKETLANRVHVFHSDGHRGARSPHRRSAQKQRGLDLFEATRIALNGGRRLCHRRLGRGRPGGLLARKSARWSSALAKGILRGVGCDPHRRVHQECGLPRGRGSGPFVAVRRPNPHHPEPQGDPGGHGAGNGTGVHREGLRALLLKEIRGSPVHCRLPAPPSTQPKHHPHGRHRRPRGPVPGTYHRGLWHELACRPHRRIHVRGVCPHSGGSGIRQRVPLPQAGHRGERHPHRHQPVETADTLAAIRMAKGKAPMFSASAMSWGPAFRRIPQRCYPCRPGDGVASPRPSRPN